MAECFQNITRHGESKNNAESTQNLPGYFSTKHFGNTYLITSGNLINNKHIEKLEGQLRQVNSMDSLQLKELYRNVMETKGLSEKGGAGLGLIEMARKSGHRLEYSFKNYDDEFSFFYNQIKLMKEDEENDFSIKDSIEYHQIMNEKGILLLQKGDFSQETILPVLDIIQQNFKKEKGTDKNKSVYHVLVELLQNISKNSLVINNRHDGIFLIQQINNSYIISAGNFVSRTKVADFESRLKTVQAMTDEQLEELYQKELLEEDESASGRAGLGLIDIAREGNEPIQYCFHEIDSQKVFFTIQVTI